MLFWLFCWKKIVNLHLDILYQRCIYSCPLSNELNIHFEKTFKLVFSKYIFIFYLILSFIKRFKQLINLITRR